MAQVESKYIPFMLYEHRRINGDLVSKTELTRERGNKYALRLRNDRNKVIGETIYGNNAEVLEDKTWDDKGKLISYFKNEYDEKGVLMTITDKMDGVVSLTEEYVFKEGAED